MELAAKEGEAKVDESLRALLAKADGSGAIITVEAVHGAMAESRSGGKEVEVAMVDLRLFDELCDAGGSESVQ